MVLSSGGFFVIQYDPLMLFLMFPTVSLPEFPCLIFDDVNFSYFPHTPYLYVSSCQCLLLELCAL